MLITKKLKNILTWLKSFFRKKETREAYNIKLLQDATQKIQDTISSMQNSIALIAKFSSLHLSNQTKNEQIHDGILKVLTQHEEELDYYEKLINQHADVINGVRKQIFEKPIEENPKKELDDKKDGVNILMKKKMNKDN